MDVVSVSEFRIKNEVIVYPNPNSGTFYVKNANLFKQFQLLDIFGNVVWEKNMMAIQSDQFNLGALKGVFFLHLRSEDKTVIRKIVINK